MAGTYDFPQGEPRPDVAQLVREAAARAVEDIAGSLDDDGRLSPKEKLLRRAYVAQQLEAAGGELKARQVTEARGLPDGQRATWATVGEFLGYGGPQQAYNAFAPGLEHRRTDARARVAKTRIPAPRAEQPGLSGLEVAKRLGVNRNTVNAWGRDGKLHTYPLRDEAGEIVRKPKGDPNGKPVLRYFLEGATLEQAAKALNTAESEVEAMAGEGALPSAPRLGEGGRVMKDGDGKILRWYWPDHMAKQSD